MAATAAIQEVYSNRRETANLGGVTLKAAALVAASEQTTGVIVGKGIYKVVVETTAVEIATGDECYIIDIEANTADTTATWIRLATVACLGAATPTGRATGAIAANTLIAFVENPYDYQLRVNLSVIGTIATGINYSVKLYPAIV
jgi:hypothetical protein